MNPPTEGTVLLELGAALCSIAAVAGTVALVDRLIVLPWRRAPRVLPRTAARGEVRSGANTALTSPRWIPGLGDVSARRGEAAAVP